MFACFVLLGIVFFLMSFRKTASQFDIYIMCANQFAVHIDDDATTELRQQNPI